ncbi:transcriptional regulator [Frondihabitans sucicola]|uniref:Transcriptional regulator n=1 Tax=Frondihabitans sucicola TaxID=1268041 RepID=A0ABN6XS95_9MICO|nr:helix-turn-helix transcriptional regulator [Frondihabitans sucicola]BDZ47788.1 transcriptional regulator [Frondihabitans sucicola]BDZ52261.1 transcriptional regulator [Frondihabitans sucicola]
MDNKSDIHDFLATRRARLTPTQAGLPDFGGKRRVPGLRREEVAMLAGVSVDYYVRLERGNLGGVSESVLEALVRALQLDDTERSHLFDLARTANATVGTRRRPVANRVRPGVLRLLDSINAPAWVRNGRMDVLAANAMGRALYSQVFDSPVTPPNTARFAFLDPRAPEFWPDWDKIAGDTVATLRNEAGRTPYDKGLTDLIGELSTRSEEFRTRWAAHDVHQHRSGWKRLHHPVVGDLELSYEALQLVTDEGLILLSYSAEPGSKSAEGLGLLASWVATEAREPLELDA